MVKLIMPKAEPNNQNTLHRSNYTSSYNINHKSGNTNINTLLNRVKINNKKEKIKELTLLALACFSILIFGIIVF